MNGWTNVWLAWIAFELTMIAVALFMYLPRMVS